MKKIIYILSAFLIGWLVLKLGVGLGCLAFCLTVVSVYSIKVRVDRALANRSFKLQIENGYIISRHPEDESELDLPDDLRDLVTWAKHSKVIKEKLKTESALLKSGNVHFCDEGLSDDQRLKVITLIFRDGEFINETWEEFRDRAVEEIRQDRACRHGSMKSIDSDWYMKFGNLQEGVVWERR